VTIPQFYPIIYINPRIKPRKSTQFLCEKNCSKAKNQILLLAWFIPFQFPQPAPLLFLPQNILPSTHHRKFLSSIILLIKQSTWFKYLIKVEIWVGLPCDCPRSFEVMRRWLLSLIQKLYWACWLGVRLGRVFIDLLLGNVKLVKLSEWRGWIGGAGGFVGWSGTWILISQMNLNLIVKWMTLYLDLPFIQFVYPPPFNTHFTSIKDLTPYQLQLLSSRTC